MAQNSRDLLRLIRNAIDETRAQCEADGSSRRLQHVLALLWSAHDEVEAAAPTRPPAVALGAALAAS